MLPTHINWEQGGEVHSRYYVLRVAKGALKGRHSPNRQFLQLGKQVCSWHFSDALRPTSDVRCWAMNRPKSPAPEGRFFDPQQILRPRRTGILPFRFRLPLNRQLLRFGDLCRGHLLRDAISIADRILVTSRNRQTEPHVCLNIVLRHA